MTLLILAAAFLLVSHFGVSSTQLRPWLVARIGERAYLAAYSLLALGALVWLSVAYRRAPFIELWPMAEWSYVVPLIVLPFALLLLIGGVSAPNPTATGQGAILETNDPVKGMLRVTRHPVMWAIALWALAHLLANGDLASLVLFGSLAALALLGTRALDAKSAARQGAAWQRFAAATSNLPLAAVFDGRQRLRFAEIGWWRIALALLLYLILLLIHPWLFGVSPVAIF
jgi:uncharacterized membrane protein